MTAQLLARIEIKDMSDQRRYLYVRQVGNELAYELLGEHYTSIMLGHITQIEPPPPFAAHAAEASIQTVLSWLATYGRGWNVTSVHTEEGQGPAPSPGFRIQARAFLHNEAPVEQAERPASNPRMTINEDRIIIEQSTIPDQPTEQRRRPRRTG